jgi:transcriptional regulator with XRE-family HTH domain
MSNQLFPAPLRFWRGRRGLSQLDLAIEADVSARHVSFLESGRAKPSTEMALRLLAALHVPLRAQTEALRAAGLAPRFPEPGLASIDPQVDLAIERMLQQQEPYPLVVLASDFGILRRNRAADALFRAFIAEPSQLPSAPDMFTLLFHPKLLRPFIEAWPAFAQRQVARHTERRLSGRGHEIFCTTAGDPGRAQRGELLPAG